MKTVGLRDFCSVMAMAVCGAAVGSGAAYAQDSRKNDNRGTMLDEIVVTATKQSTAQEAQRVPMTISAFSGEQLESLKVTNIQNLAYAMPNVSFDTPGSTKSTANFTIRGLGMNSSIASSAPTVGVFVNGMYMGMNQGILVDTFDLAGIEVLRGPQGTLFGRNVTGGAVLLNSRKPQQEADFSARLRLESGPEYSVALAGGGGLTETVSARLAFLYRKDEGYFKNVTLNDKHFGKDEVFLIKPSLRFESGGTDITLFGEYGQDKGDGPVTYAVDYVAPGATEPYGRKYRKVYGNFPGVTDLKWHSLVLNGTQDVGFGEDGQIALISGYRKFKGYSEYESDGTPLTISHNGGYTEQEQFSNELRYNGKFGIATLTVGLYQFHQNLVQFNKQFTINSTQAGRLKENTWGVFGQLDLALTDELTLQVGARYTDEKKSAKIAPLASETLTPRAGTFGIPGACLLEARACSVYQYSLKDSWSNFSPKISIRYQMDNVLLYATAQKAFRSGGMNVRYNSPSTPVPYDPEKQDAFELGFKSDLFDRTTRFNGAFFYTKVKALQRDITRFLPDLTSQVSTFNTADATVYGFEAELVQQIIPKVIFNANVGYVHAEYDKMLFDITGDRVIDDNDLNQRLPRVPKWTYSAGLTAWHDFSFGKVTLGANYSHRDNSFFPDYNTNRVDGAVPALGTADLFDAQISWEPWGSGATITLYGRNLTNDFTLSAFTPIVYPSLKNCACNPNEGRTIGVEVTFKY